MPRLSPRLLAELMLRIWRSDLSVGAAFRIYALIFIVLVLLAAGIAYFTGDLEAPVSGTIEQYEEEQGDY